MPTRPTPTTPPRPHLAHALLAVILTLAGCAAQAADQVLLVDNFNAGASSAWGNNVGGWAASSGTYGPAQPSTFPNAHSALPFQLNDFTLEFDVTHVQDGGVWLHSAPATGGIGRTGILLVLGGRTGTGSGLYFHEVTGNSYGPILGAVNGLFTPGVSDVHVRVSAVGNLVSVFLNDASQAVATWQSAAFNSGEVALYGYWPRTNLPQTRFDNVVLSQPVPEPASSLLLLAGLAGAATLRCRLRSGTV